MQMQGKTRWGWACLIIGMLGAALGCGSSGEVQSLGAVEFVGAVSEALAGEDVTRVTVTLTATGVPASTVTLVQDAGAWRGTFHQVPAGTARMFTAEAFDSQGALRYRGVAEGVTIVAGETAVVAITLQSLSTGAPFDNTVPCIDSLVASSSMVLPGGNIVLRATAHDKDVTDTFSYAWSATGGVFTTTGTSTTTWTAPQVSGEFALTLTVTDSRGAATSLRIDVRTMSTDGGPNSGGASVSVAFNMAPTVRGITVTRSPVPVGQSTTVTVDAVDADGDALTYQWSTVCAGAWTQPTSTSASFTPSAVPSGDPCGNCALTVAVSDAKGGRGQGTLRVCVGLGTGPSVPPRIVLANQSANTVAGREAVTLRVLAEDGDGAALTFGWASSVGALGTATNGFTSSEVRWTAPACVATGSAPTVTATVTNVRGFSVAHTFSVSVVNGPDCGSGTVARWDATGSMLTTRAGYTALLLPSGKVLVAGGYNGIGSTMASAELYSPDTGAWSAAGTMSRGRISHSMTMLPSGKVLVVGGLPTTHGGNGLREADLYDPQTNVWTAVASMTFERKSHTATVLPSGKVLVVGGAVEATGGGRIPELYDPETNSWVPVASSSAIGRGGHFALLLPSGKVLVAGGNSIAELYDVATNTWAAATGLTGGWTHAFLLPSGKVLMHVGTSLWEYDPLLNVQRSVGTWNHHRNAAHLVMLPSGRLMLTGGLEGVGLTTELFDPATGVTTYSVSMPSARAGGWPLLLPSGKVLIAGGVLSDNNTYVNTAVLYTP
ncbi:kelch-like protein [Myxococcus llanfairpwllgwyngyllgogerychwyrndrobwllllantysiliogogogochensis]|uniref:Kelch-like protein n=1 Tax=Myxococcus llanfairpwllgwyngyllgogerychwyrndrobwllllantysiliogogogochensis TaxID=2590453 RepID=A0A540X921_9BACT|nr:kelch repeat-containing protein [Myxococcus llanfairpwllgwyngyllgogerychwyrndrobwllllantysiliogogogochensis]TQF17795.1 kelch-like protein [Myxococcus llanfairpwllgwyngyllgogerychwyrndrobwllllantysiliogogogochensis]